MGFDVAARLILIGSMNHGSGEDDSRGPAEQPPPVVLDVGAGDCSWLLKLLAIYPEAQLHALDPLPRPSSLAVSITYHAQPAAQLPFGSDSVDLIHARKLLSSLSGEGALVAFVGEAARCLRPRGLVVFVEGRNAAPAGAAKGGAQGLLVRNLARSYLARSGVGSVSTPLSVSLPALLRAHGFQDVYEESLGHASCATEEHGTILKRPAEDQTVMLVIWATKG